MKQWTQAFKININVAPSVPKKSISLASTSGIYGRNESPEKPAMTKQQKTKRILVISTTVVVISVLVFSLSGISIIEIDGKIRLVETVNSIYFEDGFHNKGEYTGTVDTKTGKATGKGTALYADGDVYVGGWKDGRRDGQGTMTYADGAVLSGIWIHDEFIYKYQK